MSALSFCRQCILGKGGANWTVEERVDLSCCKERKLEKGFEESTALVPRKNLRKSLDKFLCQPLAFSVPCLLRPVKILES